MSENGKNVNEWNGFGGSQTDENVTLDELTEVQKQQVMQYVYAAVPHYLKQDRARITQLEQANHILQNALNVLFACLEQGLPVKEGKITLGPEEMRVLTAAKTVN